MSDLIDAVRASTLAELAWPASGGLGCRGVVALVRGGRPTVVFTYADEAIAREVAGAGAVTLALTESRGTGAAFRPLVLRAAPRLVEDPTGDIFVEELLDQELRRFPPSRVLADSVLLRREHWWYLPRLVVELDVTATEPLPGRTPPHDHLLVTGNGDVIDVHPVAVPPGPDGPRARLALETAGASAAGAPGDALLFGQDASFPDLERWTQWTFRGHWDGAGFEVTDAPARTGLGRAPGLMQRWRRQRALERGCRNAIPRV